jgi:hypothetical protein
MKEEQTMKKAEIITSTVNRIKRNAYTARVHDELQGLGYDVGMQKYERDTASGKAFGAMELYAEITGKAADDIYEAAVEEATQDIIKTNYNIVKLLNLAGYDGEAYYSVHQKYYA